MSPPPSSLIQMQSRSLLPFTCPSLTSRGPAWDCCYPTWPLHREWSCKLWSYLPPTAASCITPRLLVSALHLTGSSWRVMGPTSSQNWPTLTQDFTSCIVLGPGRSVNG
ncbi:hypothetical protein GDO81_011251 [Engystomops pustulosus]|uniref:Uncharacterized protein n=1 Tax=Engystomops pustulosus TaxID=76066 RepID=A0AAV7BD98_ENGPU|nr:hypothetical protein GDO81_011251 [Engystomops pustulosus]